jgi:hypothetical protein
MAIHCYACAPIYSWSADVTPSADAAWRDDLLTAAAAGRAGLPAGRSERLHRLFDYLLSRTLDDDPPSEQQIAADIFAEDSLPGREQGANVRVHVHRLRKALDAVFTDSAGARVYIPAGEYRILLREGDAKLTDMLSAHAFPRRWLPLSRPHAMIAGLVVLVLLLLAIPWWTREGLPRDAPSLIGQVFDQANRPLAIVIGDYYMFGDLAEPAKAPQLVWDQAVPTREDLTILQMLDPAHASNLVDYDQQFATGATIEALSMLRVSLARSPSFRGRSVRILASSQLTPDILKCCDIIYLGQFSGMAAMLRDPLAQASGFRIDPGFGGLVDRATSRAFRSDGMNLIDDRIPRRDYAYLSTFPGPAGNRLMVIAGLGEAGLKEAAQLASDRAQLPVAGGDADRIAKGFEALYRVRTIQNVNVGATPVLSRPLRAAAIWDDSGKVPPYRPLGGEASSQSAPD